MSATDDNLTSKLRTILANPTGRKKIMQLVSISFGFFYIHFLASFFVFKHTLELTTAYNFQNHLRDVF